jgi:hypothetical protein
VKSTAARVALGAGVALFAGAAAVAWIYTQPIMS